MYRISTNTQTYCGIQSDWFVLWGWKFAREQQQPVYLTQIRSGSYIHACRVNMWVCCELSQHKQIHYCSFDELLPVFYSKIITDFWENIRIISTNYICFDAKLIFLNINIDLRICPQTILTKNAISLFCFMEKCAWRKSFSLFPEPPPRSSPAAA